MSDPDKSYKYRYTIGILFTPDLHHVLLIEKQRPDWQKGKFNFPGGKIEEGETSLQCVRREFIEETDLAIDTWQHIGQIDNEGDYYVDIFTAVHPEDFYDCYTTFDWNMSDENVFWNNSLELPINCLSNVCWLVPFAKNFFEQGNRDLLNYGYFRYVNQRRVAR